MTSTSMDEKARNPELSTPAKTGSETKDDEQKGSIKDYFRIFQFCDRLDWLLYGISFICSVGAGAALPLMTIIFGQFTTKFTSFVSSSGSEEAANQFRSDVDHFILWFIYLFAARFVVVYISNVTVSIAAIRTTRTIRKTFLEKTLRQEIWHFDKQSIGSVSSQVTTNGNRINQGIAEKLAAVWQGLSLFFSAFVVAIAVQWKLALIVMSIVPAIIISISACIAVDAALESRITRLYSRGSVLAQEAISSVKTVHAFWAQEKIVKGYDEYLSLAHKAGKKKSAIYGIMFSTEQFLVLSGTALAFWQGFRMFLSGEIEGAGTVINVVLSVTIGATAMSMIFPQIQAITNASSAASELFSIIDKESLLDPLAPGGKQPPSCHGEIEIKNLCFAYPARPDSQVLHSLNLSIPAGKRTALVGASGCGKSTLVGLLERWYQPDSGEIVLDGVDISEYNTKWLRSNIRLVQQEATLFTGTVFQNVAKGFVGSQAGLPQDKQMRLVIEACKSSNAHDFIQELPQGYQTQVGERASMLSGGQRQRLAIARSIISDPKVLLLDEATSALDPRAEGLVQDALDRVSVDKTTLVIAHKLATVRTADNIVVMSYGNVMEQGTHNELIELDGQYAALVRAQDLGSGQDLSSGQDLGSGQDFGSGEKKKPQRFSRQVAHSFEIERTITLQWPKTENESGRVDSEIERLTAGTVGMGLWRCVYLMLMEQEGLKPWFAVGILACLIGGGTYPAQALLFSRLINVFVLPRDEAQSQANFFSLMFFIVALANWFGYFALGWSCNVIGQTVTHRYRKEMLHRMINLDQDFFDRPENSSGALTAKLTSAPNALLELISANLLLIFIVLVNVVSSSVLAIAYGWKLGLVVVFGGMPLLLLCGYVKIRLDQRLETLTGEWFSESAGLATEAVTSIRTVASLTLEQEIMKEYTAKLDKIVATATRSLLYTMVGYALSQALEFLIMALGFWYGSRLIASGEYTIVQFFVIFIAVIFGGQAAGQFFGYSTSITKAKVAANYLLWLRTLQSSIREDDDNKNIGPSGDGAVGVENVEFRYKQRDASRVLRGVSMKVEPGSYVACVGPSGCGKTTIISLLERFYDPISGRITLNTKDIRSMSPKHYRQYMSLVQQEPTLFQGSVRENIALGLHYEPSDDEIMESCRQANALEFVSSLPEGLSTPCGGKGLQFSGGQRQRIAIARALIRNPRLLLLDEATSALDTQSERIVQKTLDEAAAKRTTIAVAHRLSTIKHADAIFVFANGRIAEAGTHEELQRLRGRYYEMCLAQSLDKA